MHFLKLAFYNITLFKSNMEQITRASEPHGTLEFVMIDTKVMQEWGVPDDVLHELIPSLAFCRFEKGKPLFFKLHNVETHSQASIIFEQGKFRRMVLRREKTMHREKEC